MVKIQKQNVRWRSPLLSGAWSCVTGCLAPHKTFRRLKMGPTCRLETSGTISCKWPTWCTVLFSCIFIPILYMFRAPLCSSSGESIVLIQNLVYVNYVGDRQVCRLKICTLDGHLHSWHIPDFVLIQLILLMMSTGVLETCRELEWICVYPLGD